MKYIPMGHQLDDKYRKKSTLNVLVNVPNLYCNEQTELEKNNMKKTHNENDSYTQCKFVSE